MNLKRLIVASVALAALSPGAWADDVTSTYLINAGFDDVSGYATTDAGGDVKSLDVTGWTVTSSAGNGYSAAYKFGSGYKVNNAVIPETDESGSADGGALGISVGWSGTVTYGQTVQLTPGQYTMTYKVYNAGSAAAIGANKFGIVPGGGTAVYGTSTSYTVGEWKTESVTLTLKRTTICTISVGFTAASGVSGNTAKLYVDYVTLDKTNSWDDAKTEAESLLSTYTTGAETERAALKTKLNSTSNPTDKDTEELFTLLQKFEDVCKYSAEIEQANTTQSDKAGFKYRYSSVLSPDLTTWESDDYRTNNGDQHWSGASSYKYYEQLSADWSANSWSRSAQQSVTLPAGEYAMFIAARASSGVTSTMSVKVGENNAETVNLPSNGDTGRGIDVNGISTYYYDAIYANNGVGRGWEYKYIKFTVEGEEQTVVISLKASASTTHQWVSIADPMLYGNIPEADVYRVVYLNPAITKANADILINAGDSAFQRPTTTFQKAIAAAQEVNESESATGEDVLNAATTLNEAVTAFADAEITAPEGTTAYNIVLNTDAGWTYNKNAINASVNASAQGGYSLGYNYAPGATNYTQSIYFKQKRDVTNGFILSFVDADGETRYICTAGGGGYTSGNTAGIRTTTDETKALTVKIIPSTTADGIYQLYNTEASNYIGSQDAGVYTVNSHTTFNLTKAAEKSVTRDVAEGKYATIILPYEAELPKGAVAYTVDNINDNYVNLTQVTGGLEANKPYILGAGNYSFSGLATALNPTYADNNLTGVLVETAVPTGSYVLQTKEEAQAFYVVGENATLNLAENRAYLTLPTEESASSALRISFGDNNTTTGIEAVEALTSGKAEIYDLNGRKLNGLRKGINIVNGVKVYVK
jgi:hypothetical protein